jgi:hypothetical protein
LENKEPFKLKIMKNSIYILLIISILSLKIQAQVVETNQVDTTTSKIKQTSKFLNAASFVFANTAPSANLKTYKLTAYIGNSPFNFYLYNTIPLYVSKQSDSTRALSNDLLTPNGGLISASLAKTAYFANGGDIMNKDIKGAQLDFRIGAKLMDKQFKKDENSISNYFIPSLQSTLDLRYLIPLVFVNGATKGEALRNNISGNLSFRFFGTFQQILNEKQFNKAFKTPRGNVPPSQVITGNFEANLFITNEIFLSAGYSYSNLIQPVNLNVNKARTFFAISFLK